MSLNRRTIIAVGLACALLAPPAAAAPRQDLRSPDARDAATAPRQDLRSPDARDAGGAPGQDLRSPDARDAASPAVKIVAPPVATFAAPLDPPEAAPAVSGSGISAMSILLASGGYLLAVLVVTLTAVRTRRARAHTNAGSAA